MDAANISSTNEDGEDVVDMFIDYCMILFGSVSFMVGLVFIVRTHHCTDIPISGPNEASSEDDGDLERNSAAGWDLGLRGITSEERRKIMRRVIGSEPFATTKMLSVIGPKVTHGSTEDGNENDRHLDSEGDPEAPTNIELGATRPVIESENVVDTDNTCAICLCDYDEGDATSGGNHCKHRFHTTCLMEWAERHICCPCCRERLATPEEFQILAREIIDNNRCGKLLTTIKQHVGSDSVT